MKKPTIKGISKRDLELIIFNVVDRALKLNSFAINKAETKEEKSPHYKSLTGKKEVVSQQ